MTNRDKLNNMSNEEFADFLDDRRNFCYDYCIYKDACECCDYFNTECFIKWLESEAVNE